MEEEEEAFRRFKKNKRNNISKAGTMFNGIRISTTKEGDILIN